MCTCVYVFVCMCVYVCVCMSGWGYICGNDLEVVGSGRYDMTDDFLIGFVSSTDNELPELSLSLRWDQICDCLATN